MAKNFWTNEELEILECCYKNQLSAKKIEEKIPNHSVKASMLKASHLGLTKKYMKNNHKDFHAEYQDYDWCFNHFITQGKTIKQIADETGYKQRTLEKWINEKHKLSNKTYRQYATLTPLQYSIILAGTLGDGHIDKREKYAIYIESHAEYQKEYLFWKYNILSNLCASEPSYTPEEDRVFYGKKYHCQATYRMETRAIDALKEIRSMSISERLDKIDEIGFCTHMLDDGCRYHTNWEVCLGDWTQEEIEKYMYVVKNKFNLHPHQKKDKRYLTFISSESNKIDVMILQNIPNELDIIQNKIFRRGC